MKKLIALWITFTNWLFPNLEKKRQLKKEQLDRTELATSFKEAIEDVEATRKQYRDKSRTRPQDTTSYEYLYGFGFNPTDAQMIRLSKITVDCRKNGWKWMTQQFLAKIIVSKSNLEDTLPLGLDVALDKLANYHFGTILKHKLPGRNDTCICGSGEKFKKCCIKQFA